MSLKMSRRGFVKATAAATASTLLLGSQAATAFADDAAEGEEIQPIIFCVLDGA